MKQLEYMIQMYKQNLSMILLLNNDQANGNNSITGKEGKGGTLVSFFFSSSSSSSSNSFIHSITKDKLIRQNANTIALNRTLTGL